MGTRAVPIQAVHLAKRWEGLRLKAYYCPAGFLTIGYGHTGSDVTPGLVITKEKALELLRADLEKHMAQAIAQCPSLAVASDGQLAAITDFTFNLGELRLATSTLRKRINASQWNMVPFELRKWVYAAGKKLQGLIDRREAEIAIL
jgi:lysozyme